MKAVTVSTITAVKDFLDNLKNEILELVDSGEVETALNEVGMTLTKANSTTARTLSKAILETLYTDQEFLDFVDAKVNALMSDSTYLSEALVEVCEAYEIKTEDTDSEDEGEDEDDFDYSDVESAVVDEDELVEA